MRKIFLLSLLIIVLPITNSVFAEEITLFGPIKCQRTKGRPFFYQHVFEYKAVTENNKLIIHNGDKAGHNRVSSAQIQNDRAT